MKIQLGGGGGSYKKYKKKEFIRARQSVQGRAGARDRYKDKWEQR